MADLAYRYMDWPRIEDVIYGEEKHPREVLAPAVVKEGILYQCYFPDAKEVFIKTAADNKTFAMTSEDEAGYFAVVLDGKKPAAHTFLVDGIEKGDPYAFPCMLSTEEEGLFNSGIWDRAYHRMGAHLMKAGEVPGVYFVLWAPDAVRVSVVGEFNRWDGRANPMQFHEESGIYELFIPGIKAGDLYRYELKLRDGLVYTRPDPFGSGFEMAEVPSSKVVDLSYAWHDTVFRENRKKYPDTENTPVAVLECPLPEYQKRWNSDPEAFASHVKEMGYSYVEFPPLMEYEDESAGGYQSVGYFAPTVRLGDPRELKKLVDTLHKENIAVIFDWTPAQFSADSRYLASFDGTCLFEHLDPRQGIHPMWGTRLFNYGRPEVRSFLFSSAAFWFREFHADGLRLDGCATMLRLDYGRAEHEWVPNMYGSNENLEGIDFLRRLSTVIKRNHPERLLMLEEGVDWPDTTADIADGGLGFDYEWDLHFTEEMLRFISLDSEERKEQMQIPQNSMLYHYFKKCVFSLSRGLGNFDEDALLKKINGDGEEQAALLRSAYAWLFMHPGKKLLTAGEEMIPDFFRDLLRIYQEEQALYELDYREAGFEWINTMDSDNGVISFMRKGNEKKGTLICIWNISDESLARYRVGVPYTGKYKEILNTDQLTYGGSGFVNARAKASRPTECDERPQSILLRIAPRSFSVFRYQG